MYYSILVASKYSCFGEWVPSSSANQFVFSKADYTQLARLRSSALVGDSLMVVSFYFLFQRKSTGFTGKLLLLICRPRNRSGGKETASEI